MHEGKQGDEPIVDGSVAPRGERLPLRELTAGRVPRSLAAWILSASGSLETFRRNLPFLQLTPVEWRRDVYGPMRKHGARNAGACQTPSPEEANLCLVFRRTQTPRRLPPETNGS